MADRPVKVYIPNKSAHDFSDAKRVGELVFITSGTQPLFSVNNMHRVCEEALKDSSPNDYILHSGLNILCSMLCSVFAVKHGRLNLLIWRNDRYLKREVVLRDDLEEDV